MQNILWLIAARSGSQSIPHKNIRLLQGLPLMAYKIKTALSIAAPENVWCSTDSEQYATIAKEYGATVPFLRPAALATNTASSADVVLHAMDVAREQGKKADFIALLEPTSPFVYAEHLQRALEQLAINEKATAIVAVKEARPNTIFIQDDADYLAQFAEQIQTYQQLGRQHFKPQITPSGGFYISRWEAFEQYKTFYTATTLRYRVPVECEVEIDEEIDWVWAEFLVEKEIVKKERLFHEH